VTLERVLGDAGEAAAGHWDAAAQYGNEAARLKRAQSESGPLHPLACPITRESLREPVCATDGITYEREAVQNWLANHETSPLTGALLTLGMLVPNVALR
jgi:hypothetical protein